MHNASESAALDLAIVVVSYNVRDLLRRCLKSVAEASRSCRSRVWVVDNASTDGCATMVAEEFPDARLILSKRNGGFAYGNNLALREILADCRPLPRYVVLLNNDTELPPNALEEMIRFMDTHPEAGAAGPRLVKANGELDLACRRSFPSPEVSLYRMTGLSKVFPRSRRFARYNLTFLDPGDVAEVDSVVGAFMMVRGEILRDVGLLDEAFFFYGEDLDWALRIKKAGWKVLYNGKTTVLHHKGASSVGYLARNTVEFYRAMRIFVRKHYAESTWPPLLFAINAAIDVLGMIGVVRCAVSSLRSSDRSEQARNQRGCLATR